MKNLNWLETRISEIASVYSGAGFPDRYQGLIGCELPFYKVSDMNIAGNEREMFYENNSITEVSRHELGAFLFPEGSTIFPKIGGAIATNKKRLTTRRCCVDNNIMGGVPRDGKVDSQFLFYFFLKHDLSMFANEAHLPSIRKTVVESWPIALPNSLSEQRRIVAILDEAFEAIAIAKANAEKNLLNIVELFETHLATAFAQQGEVMPLSECATDISDGDHAAPPKSSMGIPFITISNVDKETRCIDFTDTFTVAREYFDALKPYRKPKRGDVLYTVTGSFGIPVLVQDEREFCFQRHIGLIRPRPDVDSRWLMFALLSPQVRAQAEKGATETAQRTVSLGTLRAMTVPKVGIGDQRKVVAQVDLLHDRVVRLREITRTKLVALDELKKSLLHQAFTGQLNSSKAAEVARQPALQTTAPEFTANVIAIAYARHARQQREKTFGRVKEQKVLQVVESIGKIDLDRHPMKDAAGPNDFKHMLRAEEWAKAHNFFEMVKRGEGYEFRKLSAFDEHLASARQMLAPYLPQLEPVIDFLVPMDTEDAEVFVTVHAAWNNLLIDGVEVTDSAIVSAAREGWHADKLKKPEYKFRNAIALIRQKGLVPDGTAKYVGGQQSLPL
ncbi:hypothetical protein BH11PSE9_BH11PSE9_10480 [soil metagenome]